VLCNRELRGDALERHAPLTAHGREALRRGLAEGRLTMRGAQRVRAVALTLCDLRGGEPPLDVDLVEQAMLLRGGERSGWDP
jgi:predicted ATPase with chaperone activity